MYFLDFKDISNLLEFLVLAALEDSLSVKVQVQHFILSLTCNMNFLKCIIILEVIF